MQSENSVHACHVKKKRVGKACDSRRIKKTKCDGKKPCNRCLLDNKICVFTEKRKVKEKIHPPGYIELLETRLDILSKLFEKLIELSRPHLPFIDEIVQEESASKKGHNDNVSSSPESSEGDNKVDSIPINKIVSYLIEQRGLLQNVPVDWEEGALIAANFRNDNLQSSSQAFAEHKSEKITGGGSDSFDLHSPPVMRPVNRACSTSSSRSQVRKMIKEEPISPASSHSFSGNFNLNSDEQWVANDQALSELGSDSLERNSGMSPPSMNDNQQHKQQQRNGDYNGHNQTPLTASLFSNNYTNLRHQPISKNPSLTSLSNKYEAHTLSSAPNSSSETTPPSSIFTTNSPITLSTVRRSSSTLSQPQNNKLKSCIAHHHHVHKPVHHSRHSSLEVKKRSNSFELSPTGSIQDGSSHPSSAVASIADEFIANDRYYDAMGDVIALQPSFESSPTNQLMDRAMDDGFYNEVARGPLNFQGPGAFEVLIGAYEDSLMNNRSFLEKY